jgi:hypothetical protein
VTETYNVLAAKRASPAHVTTADILSIIEEGLGPAGLCQFHDLSRICPNDLLNCYNRFELVWNLDGVKNVKVKPWRPTVQEAENIHGEFRKLRPAVRLFELLI